MNVMFYSVKLRSTFDAIEKNNLALYWIEETQELYKGEKLFGVGREASVVSAGLLSAEDKAKLDALVTGNGLADLLPVDGSIVLADTEGGGKSIGVAISAQEGNILSLVEDGLFVSGANQAGFPEFTVEKQSTAEDGFAATYRLKRTFEGESAYVGDSINLFKDLVLQSAVLSTVTEANIPYEGAAIGDPFIHMVFNDASASDIYIPVKGLVDTYTSGAGISITDNVISVKIAEESHGLVAVDGALSLSLATRDSDGAMSKEDKLIIDSIPSVYVAHKYEVSSKPVGTLVSYTDSEVRVMCPADTNWTFQNSGENADANLYYIGFKAYAPSNAVSFKETLGETVTDDTMYYFEGNDFAGIDEYGRKYSIVWLPVAAHDGTVWNYYGASSSEEKYIGWYYSVNWYDINGRIIEASTVRINLSNEDCHTNLLPYYVSGFATISELEDIKSTLSTMEASYVWGEL